MKKIIITIGKNSQTIFLLIVLVIGLVILLNTIAFFYKKHKNPRFSQKEFLNNIFYKDQSQVYVLVRKKDYKVLFLSSHFEEVFHILPKRIQVDIEVLKEIVEDDTYRQFLKEYKQWNQQEPFKYSFKMKDENKWFILTITAIEHGKYHLFAFYDHSEDVLKELDYLDLNKNIQAALIVRIKILSNMDIAEKRLPQDGHFMGVIDGVELNIRVSVIPTIFGEKIVMRYLNSNSTIDRLSTFGMTEENFKKVNHMMSMPHGIIYVTGPTGSGKTTTLYMILEKLAQGQINISTIEDPVERKLNRINQMQVNTMSGLTFDRGLRALMRQDPDVIMVGETRDKETAEISVRAAITGHLVVSTLHTNDAISTIVRLEEMGVEPYMVANSLVGVVAQRLMRKVCPYCKKEVATSLSDRLALQEGIKYISKGTGCPHCNQTGYKGRIAIHEVIEIDSKVRKMISNQEEIDDIMKYLVEEQGVETLRDQALKLVKEGKTTVDEFNKIIAYID